MDGELPHVLLRHFAAKAVLACADKGGLKLSKADAKALKSVSASPFSRKMESTHDRSSFYDARPDTHPEPEDDFHLDYDFDKADLQRISDTFDVVRWEVKDALTSWVRKFDKTVTSMYERGGRYTSQRESLRGMTARRHGYGQQLGWHGSSSSRAYFWRISPLLIGDTVTVTAISGRNGSTAKCSHEKTACRLADGVDRTPIDTQVNLKERGEKGLVLTGSKEKLLALLRIEGDSIPQELTIGGNWRFADGIEVHRNVGTGGSEESHRIGNATGEGRALPGMAALR